MDISWNLLLFHCLIVLSIQVTQQSVIRRESDRPESNAQKKSAGKRLLIYSGVSQGYLRIVSRKNISANAKKDDPYAVIITDFRKEGITIMGEKSKLYLCIHRKNGKMVAMMSPKRDRKKYYCFYKEEMVDLYTTYSPVDKLTWKLLFSRDGYPRRANNTRVDPKKTIFLKDVISNKR
ncbi:fibroblast growth factor 8-like isoform X2 [Antedon mediterranea]|uniref:fibroblast growth factor 8-like isoform X2 n=1 Tax=Antedon mediterranea TaxID=105859 RepID=UPI003AF63E38